MTDREKFEAWFAPLRSQMQNNGLGGTAIERRQELQWSAWQAAIASQNEPGDGWIDWAGGECPVRDSESVIVIFRDGDMADSSERAGNYAWNHDGKISDIVSYRVVNP